MKTPKAAPSPQINLFRPEETTPKPFKKAVQVVHSKPRGQISFVQRKTLNALLRNATKNEPTEGWWAIRTAELARDIGFDSNNRNYLRQATLDLMSIVFEWDVLAAKSKSGVWMKASVLFSDFEITREEIRYRINSELQHEVLDPDIYALVDMQIQLRMKKGASLAIYEFCIRFERIGHTATLPWESFRDMILGEGKHTNTYKEYKYFKQKVLKPAIAELNSIGDLHITLREITNGRKVEGLAFDLVRIAPPGVEGPEDEKLLVIVGELVELGVAQSEAKKLVRTEDVDKIQAAIGLTRKRMADKKLAPLDKPAAYFRSALKNGWPFEDAKIVRSSSASKQGDGSPKKTKSELLLEKYMADQRSNAEAYFKELDERDQSALIQRYNDQQPTAGLRISKRSGKGALVAYYTWLGLDTWGAPSSEELLEFATNTLMA